MKKPKVEIMTKSGLRRTAWSSTLESILTIVFGVLLVVWQDDIVRIIAYLVGGFLLLKGGFTIASYMFSKEQKKGLNGELVLAIVTFLIGVVIFAVGEQIADVFRVLVGVLIIYEGLIRLDNAMKLRSAGVVNWSAVMAIAIIMLTFGMFLAFFNGAMAFLIGWFLIVTGLIGLFSDVMFMQNTSALLEKLGGKKK
ncbi:DUF308 domain-containing protein [Candidatus Saccharibacteria bacterium]|nr:DUF308 domain-containing protein [Candidatus Saccharibacteria bacterium]